MVYIAMSEETHARRGKKGKVVVLDNEAAALRKTVQASRSFFSGGFEAVVGPDPKVARGLQEHLDVFHPLERHRGLVDFFHGAGADCVDQAAQNSAVFQPCSPRKRRLTTVLSLEEYVPFASFLPSFHPSVTPLPPPAPPPPPPPLQPPPPLPPPSTIDSRGTGLRDVAKSFWLLRVGVLGRVIAVVGVVLRGD